MSDRDLAGRHLAFCRENLSILGNRRLKTPAWYSEAGFWWGQIVNDLEVLHG